MATKNESNKGDSKGDKLSKEHVKRLAKRMKELSISDDREIDDGFIDWLMSDREILKNFINSHIKIGYWSASKILPFQGKSGVRKRSYPKREAFHKWVKENNIDTKLSLDRLTLEVQDAYNSGKISIQIGRDTVRQCLKTLR